MTASRSGLVNRWSRTVGGCGVPVIALGMVVSLASCERSKKLDDRPLPATQATATNSMGSVTCEVIDGAVKCCGQHDWGLLGTLSKPPSGCATIPGIGDARAVAVGMKHACALHASGDVSCWGSRLNGLMGSPEPKLPTNDMPANDVSLLQVEPARVAGVTQIVEITATDDFTCGRATHKTIMCWGKSTLPGGEGKTGAPYTLPGVERPTKLGAGMFHLCWFTGDEAVKCYGDVSDDSNQVLFGRGRIVLRARAGERLQVNQLGVCAIGRNARRCWGRYLDF